MALKVESVVSRAQMASQAVRGVEGIGRSVAVAAASRMGTVPVEEGGMYSGEQAEDRKSGRRAIGEGEGKDEGGGQEGIQGGWRGGGEVRDCVPLKSCCSGEVEGCDDGWQAAGTRDGIGNSGLRTLWGVKGGKLWTLWGVKGGKSVSDDIAGGLA